VVKLAGDYLRLSAEDVYEGITRAKVELGRELLILGHHYQGDEVIRFADYRGDSLELCRAAAAATHAKYVVFCGVDFMAESAAMLCGSAQEVFLPAETARCPMAAMADVADARKAWEHLTSVWCGDVVPVTYQNSSAELKAFCGRHGGVVCTSSNARAVMEWGLTEKGHVLFFADEHLGRNSALGVGVSGEDIAVWNPERRDPPEGLGGYKVVVWNGYCHVHTFFTVDQVARAREMYPQASVIVHPECPAEVVASADGNGSTSFIVKAVEDAPTGSTLVIGTEVKLVSRLAREHPEKTVVPLAHSACDAMSQVTQYKLLYTLEGVLEGRMENIVQVPEEIAGSANRALERMLEVT